MAYENFTTYTEVDADGDITVAANTITVDTMRITANSYVTKSHGANHFGNFEHKIDVRFTTLSTSNYTGFWGISNSHYTILSMDANNEGVTTWIANVGGDYRIYLRDFTNDNSDFYGGLALSTSYYTTIKRDGTTATCKIYSDSARTNLLDTLTITCTNATYSNVIPMFGYDNNVNSRSSTYTVDNLDLQEEETLNPVDDANASDAITFDVEEHMADDAKANDTTKFDATKLLSDNAKASDTVNFDSNSSTQHTAHASDDISFQMFHAHNIGDTAKASDSLTFDAEINLVDIAKASDLYSDNSPPPVAEVIYDSSCPTFSLLSASYSIYFTKPIWGGEQYNLQKDLQSFNFWSGNFNIHDKGIASEPIILSGVEIGSQNADYTHDMFIAKFVNIRAMSRNNEEVTISGLGNCIDAVYVIKSFSTKTMHKPDARIWTLTLEYVRDA
jgi:plastocyanin